jgi:hypothetical protein
VVTAVDGESSRNGGGEEPKEGKLVAWVVFEVLDALVEAEEEEGNHPVIDLGGVFSDVSGVVGLGEEEELGGEAGEVVLGKRFDPGKGLVVMKFDG